MAGLEIPPCGHLDEIKFFMLFREGVEIIPSTNSETVRILTETLEVGRLYKYSFGGSQADIRFFAIRRDEEDFAVALDACGICPPFGYHQEGHQVICDNCNAPINMATIGMPGGCNPIHCRPGSRVAIR